MNEPLHYLCQHLSQKATGRSVNHEVWQLYCGECLHTLDERLTRGSERFYKLQDNVVPTKSSGYTIYVSTRDPSQYLYP